MKMMVQIAVEENGDYETAVMYQRRIVDLSDARAMRTGRLEDVVTFFGDLSALGDYCYSMQDVSSCEEVCRQMIAALEGIRDLTGHKALLEYVPESEPVPLRRRPARPSLWRRTRRICRRAWGARRPSRRVRRVRGGGLHSRWEAT